MKIRTVKKITTGILSFILAFGSAASAGAVVTQYVPKIGELSPAGDVVFPRYIVGDVNGDMKINELDMLLVEQHVKGKMILKDNNYRLRADNNFDGKINISDVVRIAAYLKTH